MIKQLRCVIPAKFVYNSTCDFSTSKSERLRSYFSITDLTNRNKMYVKKELLGAKVEYGCKQEDMAPIGRIDNKKFCVKCSNYSMAEMYEVVADVKNYYKFVPYVKKSHVHSQSEDNFRADLIIGFPPINEKYTSNVTLDAPKLVQSVCKDGRLFNYLLNEWRFSPGLKDIPRSCVLDFKVAFEFKSLLHSNVANLFFDIICEQMENAFQTEAGRRFGSPSIKSHVLSSKRS